MQKNSGKSGPGKIQISLVQGLVTSMIRVQPRMTHKSAGVASLPTVRSLEGLEAPVILLAIFLELVWD